MTSEQMKLPRIGQNVLFTLTNDEAALLNVTAGLLFGRVTSADRTYYAVVTSHGLHVSISKSRVKPINPDTW